MFTNSKKRFKLRSAKALPARRRHELAESDLSPQLLARLTPQQRAWWLRFLEEDTAGRVAKGDPRAIYKDDEQRRDAYQRNNLANRDLLNLATVTGTLASLDAPATDDGPTLGELVAGPELDALPDDELLQLAESLPDGGEEPSPVFGGEAVYLWAEAHGLRPGPLRSQPIAVLRASLEGWCRLRDWRYPFGRDRNNNLLGRALRSLGFTSFRQGIRPPGQPRHWEYVYGLAVTAHPALLDSRFWVPGAATARPAPRPLLKPGRRPRADSNPTPEEPMSKSRPAEKPPEKQVEALPPEPGKPPHEECLPVVKSLGVVPKGSRLVVVYLETQGDKVINRQVVSACPEVPGIAANTFRLNAFRRLGIA